MMSFSRARRFTASETHLQGKVVTFGGGYALWRDGSLVGVLASAAAALNRTWISHRPPLRPLTWEHINEYF